MSKYRTYERQSKPINRKDPHPIWRGIGCLIILIVPAISWAISTVLVGMAPSLGIRLPDSLLGPTMMPDILFKVPGLVWLLNKIQSINNLNAIMVGTFTVALLLGGVLALIYAFVYRYAGPPQYSKFDAPPPNIKVKKYKR